MKILITGSSGFIGFHLTKLLLEKGNKIHGYDSMNNYYDVNLKKARLKILKKYKNFSFTKNKLENKRSLEKSFFKFKPNIVIHLAAQAGVRYSIDKPRVYLRSNVTGTFNIIEASHKLKVKHLIMASSSSVYGANKKIPFLETDKTETQLSIYAATKKANESMAHSYSNLWKIPITMLRFFTVYGPWGRPDMALYIFTKAIIKNKTIDLFNKGDHTRSFTYIDDITEPIHRLIKINYDKKNEISNNEILNIGGSKPVKLLRFIDIIEKYLGKKAKINLKPMQQGDVKETNANIDKLEKITGYRPQTNIEEGIKRFIDWYIQYHQ